ncbi:MAG: PEP-CTERM sorting domain-containing protein [Telluria sp.]
MKLKKILAGFAMGAAMALSSVTASASPIDLGGVVFDPEGAFDFTAKGSLFEVLVSQIGDIDRGYGQIDRINEKLNFCPTCELTFVFDNYLLVDNNPSHLLFTGGFLNIYVHDTAAPGFTAYDPTNGFATAGDGVLWLSLAAHTDQRTNGGVLQTGTLFGQVEFGTLGVDPRGKGGGMFDVVGGLAAAHFNTNSQADSLGGFADFDFNSEFKPTNSPIPAGALPITGTGTLTGNAIPEPGSLLLVGLGLMGLAAAGKRKQKKA